MIDTITLQVQVDGYKERCKHACCRPTYQGVGKVLGISSSTISNVIHGRYNGHEYTDTPHATRCIDNDDFEVVKALFSESEVKA